MYATYSNSIPCMIMYSLFIFTTPILMQKEDSFPVALCVWSCFLIACHGPQLQIVNEAINLMEIHKQVL